MSWSTHLRLDRLREEFVVVGRALRREVDVLGEEAVDLPHALRQRRDSVEVALAGRAPRGRTNPSARARRAARS